MKTLEVTYTNYSSKQSIIFLDLEDIVGMRVNILRRKDSTYKPNELFTLIKDYSKEVCYAYAISYLAFLTMDITKEILEMAIPINTLKAFLLLNNTEVYYD